MNPLLLGSTPDGPFHLVLLLLHTGAYGALTWAFGLGCRSLRRKTSATTLEASSLRWLRAGFLLLSAGLIAHSTWTTFIWGEFWAGEHGQNLGLITWLVYAAVLHMHHVPSLRGRRTILASLAAWSLLAISLLCVNLRSDPGSVSHSTGTASQTPHTSHPGP